MPAALKRRPEQLTKQFEISIDRDPRNCVLMVGAGLSRFGVTARHSGLPDWHTLMYRFIHYLEELATCDSTTVDSLKRALARQNYLQIADAFTEQVTPQQFLDFLRNLLDPPDLCSTPLHETILSVGFKGILTTNFDCVFEEQQRKPTRRLIYPHFLADPKAFTRDGFFAKLHGCIRAATNPDEHLVITRASYAPLANNEAYAQILQSVFINPVLIVGYSLRDPDVLAVVAGLRKAFGESVPEIFFLVRRPGSWDIAACRRMHVVPLPYRNHRELRRFFCGTPGPEDREAARRYGEAEDGIAWAVEGQAGKASGEEDLFEVARGGARGSGLVFTALGEFELPEGDYTITEQRRNEAHGHDHDMGDGYYYRLTQDGASGWVWQHELTWAICTEWLAGIEIDICGPLGVSDSEVGWHVIGRGHFIPVKDEEEGLEVMARLKAI